MSSRRVSKQARSTASAVLAVVIGILLLGIILAAVWLGRLVLGDFGSGVNRGAVEVPNVVGLEEAAARTALGQAGFKVRLMPKDYNPGAPAGEVYLQQPEAGMLVKPSRPVNLFISLGPANFVVPDLSGLHLSKLPPLLAKQGFRLNSVQRVYSKQFPAGRVISQSPKKGEEFNSEGVGVDVVVADSTGLPRLPMPGLTGQALAGVEELLTRKDYNLRLGLVEYVADDSAPAGTVTGQEPAAGAEVSLGARVSLRVAMPSAFMGQRQRSFALRIPVPAGADEQPVKIKLFDALGEQVLLDEVHHPGELIERSVDTEGPAKLLVFIGDMNNPLREDRL